jgi:hypothetical protein
MFIIKLFGLPLVLEINKTLFSVSVKLISTLVSPLLKTEGATNLRLSPKDSVIDGS